jgi:hypothetical protein
VLPVLCADSPGDRLERELAELVINRQMSADALRSFRVAMIGVRGLVGCSPANQNLVNKLHRTLVDVSLGRGPRLEPRTRAVLDVAAAWDSWVAAARDSLHWMQRQRAAGREPRPMDTSEELGTALALMARALGVIGMASGTPTADELRDMFARYVESSRQVRGQNERGRIGMIAEIFARAKAKKMGVRVRPGDVEREIESLKKTLARAKQQP